MDTLWTIISVLFGIGMVVIFAGFILEALMIGIAVVAGIGVAVWAGISALFKK